MSPIAVVAVVWLSVNVLMVLLAVNWAAARKRTYNARTREMVEAAERHANFGSLTAASGVQPAVRPARRRASMT
jgi:hypothetical protein